MFDSIHIENFQSHEKSTLKLSPGINVIVGTSDSGKSAIFRLIRWIIENRPPGDDIRSNWGGDTIGTIKTSQGNIVTRKRTNSENMYILNDKEFKAIGLGVPEEIQQALGMYDLNSQHQMDRPFLLDSSPGEVATYLNNLVGLDVVNKGVKNIKKWIKQIGANITKTKTDIADLEEQAKQFENLDELENVIQRVEGLEEKRRDGQRQIQKIRSLLQQHEEVEKRIKQLEQWVKLENRINRLLKQEAEQEVIRQKRDNLKNCISKFWDLEKKMKEGQALLDLEKSVNELLKVQDQQKEIQRKIKKLEKSISTYQTLESSIKIREKQIETWEKEFEEMMPEECPLCGAPKDWHNR